MVGGVALKFGFESFVATTSAALAVEKDADYKGYCAYEDSVIA